MKTQIIKTITFLLAAPYIAWGARYDDEVEYYRNLAEAREIREQMEKWLYEDLQKDLRNKPANERGMIIKFHHLLKNTLNQGLEGVTSALCFAHWLRTKINSSEKQVAQLDKLIEKTKRAVQNLESQEFDNKTNISESDYEVINQQQIAYEKEKGEWQNLLVKLESRIDTLLAQNWINYDLVEEEIEHNGSEYTLISTIQGLKEELEIEREENLKALDKAQEWRERQIKELGEERGRQISELQSKITEIEQENQWLKGKLESQQNQLKAQTLQPTNLPFNNPNNS